MKPAATGIGASLTNQSAPVSPGSIWTSPVMTTTTAIPRTRAKPLGPDEARAAEIASTGQGQRRSRRITVVLGRRNCRRLGMTRAAVRSGVTCPWQGEDF